MYRAIGRLRTSESYSVAAPLDRSMGFDCLNSSSFLVKVDQCQVQNCKLIFRLANRSCSVRGFHSVRIVLQWYINFIMALGFELI